MKDQISSYIRIAAVGVTGFLLTFLAQALARVVGPEVVTEIIDNISPFIEGAIQVLITVIYYVVVRALASKWSIFEHLLIVPKAPVYVKPAKQESAVQILTNQRMK